MLISLTIRMKVRNTILLYLKLIIKYTLIKNFYNLLKHKKSMLTFFIDEIEKVPLERLIEKKKLAIQEFK